MEAILGLIESILGFSLRNFYWVDFLTSSWFILFILIPVILKFVPKHIKQNFLNWVEQKSGKKIFDEDKQKKDKDSE